MSFWEGMPPRPTHPGPGPPAAGAHWLMSPLASAPARRLLVSLMKWVPTLEGPPRQGTEGSLGAVHELEGPKPTSRQWPTKARALSLTASRNWILTTPWMSVEAGSSPVRPSAGVQPGCPVMQPCETLRRGPSYTMGGLLTYKNYMKCMVLSL